MIFKRCWVLEVQYFGTKQNRQIDGYLDIFVKKSMVISCTNLCLLIAFEIVMQELVCTIYQFFLFQWLWVKDAHELVAFSLDIDCVVHWSVRNICYQVGDKFTSMYLWLLDLLHLISGPLLAKCRKQKQD